MIFLTMKDLQESRQAGTTGPKRPYTQPVLNHFGDFSTLTLNGGTIQSPDAGKSTKTGR